jgi:hypothetical protein
MAKHAVTRHFRILDFRYEPGRNPVRAADSRSRRIKRRSCASKRLHQPKQPTDLGHGETGADVSCITELAAFIDRDDERTKPRSLSDAIQPTRTNSSWRCKHFTLSQASLRFPTA